MKDKDMPWNQQVKSLNLNLMANESVRNLGLAFSGPGWEEKVKVGSQLTKMSLFFLINMIEFALSRADKEKDNIISLIDEESRTALKEFAEELLLKSNLAPFQKKVKELQ